VHRIDDQREDAQALAAILADVEGDLTGMAWWLIMGWRRRSIDAGRVQS
jgi:hypothetical protein